MKEHILISRTDAIGDVVLTLPMCGFLKKRYPDVHISFLGRSYTKPVIHACSAVDEFINYDELKDLEEEDRIDFLKEQCIDTFIHVFPDQHLAFLAKEANIQRRIGTTNRMYHWLACNNLVRLSRKNSGLHEAELNMVLLKGLGIDEFPAVEDLYNFSDFSQIEDLSPDISQLLDNDKFNLVIHPKSNGNGKEWSLKRYQELIDVLPEEDFRVFITGSEKEVPVLESWIKDLKPEVVDLTGQMNLDQLIALLQHADGMIASGTGPLHLAAASGTNTLGLFPSVKTIDAKRWGPIGKNAAFIESLDNDLESISASEVYEKVKAWVK